MRLPFLVCSTLAVCTLSCTLPTSARALDLMQALTLAEQNDPNFAATRTAHNLAAQTPAAARAALLPHVTANGSITRNQLRQNQITIIPDVASVGGRSNYTTSTWGAQITQPLFDWAAFNQFKAAKFQQSRDDAKADVQHQKLILQVAEAYLAVLRAEETLALAGNREKSLGKKLEENQAKLKVGLTPRVDVLESQAQHDSAYSQRLTAENQLNNAKETLSASIGRPVSNLAPLIDHFPVASPMPNDIDAWSTLALAHNPQLKSLSSDIDASHSTQTALKGGYLPQINAIASYNDLHNTGNDSFSAALSSGKGATVGIEARWSLFDGGQTRAGTQQAAYQTELGKLQLASAQQSVRNQTRSLFLTVNTDASRIQAARQTVASAQMAYETMESGYQVGNRSIVDLLTAESNLHAARRDLAESRYDYVAHSLELYASAGMLDESVINRINEWLAH